MMPFPGKSLSAALVLALAGCAAAPTPQAPAMPPAQVEVRLMFREHAVAGASASAVRNLGIAGSEERVVATAGPDGRAAFSLAPGTWYFSAAAGDPAVFGWYGSNPVQVRAGETLALSIPAVSAAAAVVLEKAPPGEETLAGEVVGDGGAVAGAGVAVYLDASTQFRGPGYIETRTDDRGGFETRLSPGSYWIFVRRRSGPHVFGPLEAGDDFGCFPGNPLVIGPGDRVTIRIPTVRVLKKSGWSGPSALRTRVGGTVRDAAGRPLPGFRAFLHAKPTMLGKPEFVSEPSGPDGSYLIWVDREGVFYLGARAEIGRAREASDAIGLYAGTVDHAVEVRLDAGALPALDIVVGEAAK